MNESKVTLNFEDKTVPSLAGYEYGKKVFEDQVKEKIDYSADKIIIAFPNDKTAIASSFIEGFFDGIKEKIGLNAIKEKLIIESNSVKITKKIKDAFR